MEGPAATDSMYFQHDIPWKLNSCAMSTRMFPLPHEQNICSQISIPSSVSTLDDGLEQNAFSSSEDTDDNSVKGEVADSLEVLKPSPGMAELQYCPEFGEHLPHEENVEMQSRPKEVKAAEPITTLMVCDLPCCLSIQEVVDTINSQGFANTFDLIYMPRPKGLRSAKVELRHNLGYAFVNFKTPEKALEFQGVCSEFTFPSCSTKRCYTMPAVRQGYKANWKKHSRQHNSGCCLTFQQEDGKQIISL